MTENFGLLSGGVGADCTGRNPLWTSLHLLHQTNNNSTVMGSASKSTAEYTYSLLVCLYVELSGKNCLLHARLNGLSMHRQWGLALCSRSRSTTLAWSPVLACGNPVTATITLCAWRYKPLVPCFTAGWDRGSGGKEIRGQAKKQEEKRKKRRASAIWHPAVAASIAASMAAALCLACLAWPSGGRRRQNQPQRAHTIANSPQFRGIALRGI